MRQSEKNNTCKPIKKKLKRPNPSAEETLHNVLYLGVPGQIVMFWLFVEQKTETNS